MAASEGLSVETASGKWTMHRRHVDKTMFLVDCQGTEFHVLKEFPNVKHGETCT